MTVGDVFSAAEPAAEAGGRPSAGEDEPRVLARARARAKGYRSLPVVGKVASWVAEKRRDAAGNWMWRAQFATPRDLWQARIPDIGRVPGGNPGLWWAWLVVNHVVFPVLCALGFVMWVCSHPARLILGAVIAAPVVVMWIR